ncbi:MAG: 2-deoxyglucose-6-phosphate hydrolase YniC [Chitinophagaceae bacterium]|nr:2-deoxyglucose-6-phosphate hydrolase YniC [Chitinophagaceae bacterium]
MLDTVIFDMDGVLIDSEPLWAEAADEVLKEFNVRLSKEQYATTVGMRTKEFIQSWFAHYNIAEEHCSMAEKKIVEIILEKVKTNGAVMPGVDYIFNFFKQRNFKIGLASSSPMELIDLVVELTGIKPFLNGIASAEDLPYGKPHPQVYLNCAESLGSEPVNCICFEDSYNGMIAAKAAKMKCVIVPAHAQLKDERWGAADLKLSSLQNFGELHLNSL